MCPHPHPDKPGSRPPTHAEVASPPESESQPVGDGHHRLSDLLERLYGDEDEAEPDSIDELRSFLVDHFRHEEGPDGLFESVLEEAPRYASWVEQLRREHQAFEAQLERLRERPERADLDRFIEALRAHEGVEEDMLAGAADAGAEEGP